MPEFVFRNLSVKLFPVEGAPSGAVCVCCPDAVECDECSQCTDGGTSPPCEPCTDEPTAPCGACTEGPTQDPDCGCTGGATDGCDLCTDLDDSFGPCGAFSDPVPCEVPVSCVEDTTCMENSELTVIAPPDARGRAPRSSEVIQREFDLLRVELRQALDLPPDEDPARRVPDAVPVSDEIDQVRAALLDAVAELDERGRQLDPGRLPG